MHAQAQRNAPADPQDNPNVIEVTDYWKTELQASPYFSRKPPTLILFRRPRQNVNAAEEGFQACLGRIQAQEDSSSRITEGN